MDARRMGKGGGGICPSWKCYKVLFVLHVLFMVSADEVFMHYFEKMLSASGGFVPDPHLGSAPGPRWGTSVLQTPH